MRVDGEARAAIEADNELMKGFRSGHLELAVRYQSSIIGFTSFQQRAVTHQLLRAAAVGEEGKRLRSRIAKCEASFECGLAKPVRPSFKPRDNIPSLAAMLALKKGDVVFVWFDAPPLEMRGTVMDVLPGVEAGDVGVRVYYPDWDQSLVQALHWKCWRREQI